MLLFNMISDDSIKFELSDLFNLIPLRNRITHNIPSKEVWNFATLYQASSQNCYALLCLNSNWFAVMPVDRGKMTTTKMTTTSMLLQYFCKIVKHIHILYEYKKSPRVEQS